MHIANNHLCLFFYELEKSVIYTHFVAHPVFVFGKAGASFTMAQFYEYRWKYQSSQG